MFVVLLVMAPSSQELEPPANPGRFIVAKGQIPSSAFFILKSQSTSIILIRMHPNVRRDLARLGQLYRCRRSASVITPAATTTITMTVASASIEARVSYQLFQSSSMRWSLSKARPALRTFHCVERTCLCDQKCNATFRRARFDRAATWLGGMVVGEGAPARRRLVSL